MVIAGGVIPKQDYDFLYQAGVAGIYGPGTKIPEAAIQMLQLLIKPMIEGLEKYEAKILIAWGKPYRAWQKIRSWLVKNGYPSSVFSATPFVIKTMQDNG